jgi:cephalosporin-C deacetylase-like acetyl esterase
MRRLPLLTLALLLSAIAESSQPPCHAGEGVRRGEIAFEVTPAERDVPKRFRLENHRFPFEQRPLETSSQKIRIFEVTFPSPVVTPHPSNNTVHCEYLRPAAEGKHPGVIVLHILGGDFELSRLFARTLAHHGVCALFVKMPYYGPRRAPGAPTRMVGIDPHLTVQGMTQAVLDIRRATAWLGQQPEVDGQQLGVFGISLGGITGALAAAAEPRLQNIYLALAGGDIAQVGLRSPYAAAALKKWLDAGETRESFEAVLRPVDPLTYAKALHGRRIAMVNARFDEIIPPDCTVSLWRALGEPEILWLDCGHYTSGRFLFDTLARVTHFFQATGKDETSTNSPGGPAASGR